MMNKTHKTVVFPIDFREATLSVSICVKLNICPDKKVEGEKDKKIFSVVVVNHMWFRFVHQRLVISLK